MIKNNAVFLDRDGVLNKSIVINKKPYAPKTYEEFQLLPGVKRSLVSLKDLGFLIIVVTNQPDVGNGYVEKKVVQKMNSKLSNELPVDSIKVCYHKQTDECLCRKPKPGMLIDSAIEYNIDLGESFMVGDRKSDIEAGTEAGCKTIFIDNGYIKGEKPDYADIYASSLPDAVNKLISQISGK